MYSIWDIKKKLSLDVRYSLGLNIYMHKLKYQHNAKTLYRLLHLNFYTLSFSWLWKDLWIMHHNFLHLIALKVKLIRIRFHQNSASCKSWWKETKFLKGLLPEQFANYRNQVRINSSRYTMDRQWCPRKRPLRKTPEVGLEGSEGSFQVKDALVFLLIVSNFIIIFWYFWLES